MIIRKLLAFALVDYFLSACLYRFSGTEESFWVLLLIVTVILIALILLGGQQKELSQ